MSTISGVELHWVTVTGMGLALSSFNAIRATRVNYLWRKREGTELQKFGARFFRWAAIREAGFAIAQMGAFVVGVAAMFIPAKPIEPGETATDSSALIYLFFVMAYALLLGSIVGAYIARYLVDEGR